MPAQACLIGRLTSESLTFGYDSFSLELQGTPRARVFDPGPKTHEGRGTLRENALNGLEVLHR
jgi:hypothetical protein